MLDVWFASLGPVTSALLEDAVRAAIGRTPPPPPSPKKKEPKLIAGYELVKPLGEGGIGSVWLVRKPGADRFFVLKIPKAEALQNANDTEREGILASFVEEAKALAGLYHPNVANIIDRGIFEEMPYLVLEYLIGADLKQYAGAKPMSLFELRNVVSESCAGLAALHSAGLVHRDIKPANLWLRLPLAGGERFDPEKHRDPARATPLSAVVIDFGMVRAIRVPQDAAGRFVAGTAGYIAPEQVLDPIELDPRSDVYALAGTVYNVTTGRAFFDDIDNPRDRIMAHMRRDPLEDAERLRTYPAAVAKLLRAATAQSPNDRPSPIEFGKEFTTALWLRDLRERVPCDPSRPLRCADRVASRLREFRRSHFQFRSRHATKACVPPLPGKHARFAIGHARLLRFQMRARSLRWSRDRVRAPRIAIDKSTVPRAATHTLAMTHTEFF
jgi:serine/threonine-protein kinase